MPHQKTTSALDHKFIAPIEKDGSYPTFVTFSDSPQVLGTKRAVKVEGTVDGVPFEATLMPSGSGPHWLPLRAAICKEIGKSETGQEVTVHLTKRHS